MNEATSPLLKVSGLTVRYPAPDGWSWLRRRMVRAVDGVSFHVGRGETLLLLGETGCGKSSILATVLRMVRPTSGRLAFDGRDLTTRNPLAARSLRQRIQPLPHDPRAALSPRRSLAGSIGEPLRAFRIAGGRRLREVVRILAREVGLADRALERLPHQLPPIDSFRACLARALALSPELLVADEPFAALDMTTRQQALALLDDIRRSHELTLLLATRDLAVARRLGGRIALLERGVVVETGPTLRVLGDPLHPYTRALAAAAPPPDPRLRLDRIPLPPPTEVVGRPVPGCRFRDRCPAVRQMAPLDSLCASQRPPMRHSRDGRSVRCLLFGGLDDGAEGEAELQTAWAQPLADAGYSVAPWLPQPSSPLDTGDSADPVPPTPPTTAASADARASVLADTSAHSHG